MEDTTNDLSEINQVGQINSGLFFQTGQQCSANLIYLRICYENICRVLSMIINANGLEGARVFKADICILGGGVAGIVLANELLNSGKSIVLLESGNKFYDEKTQNLYKAESIPPFFPDPLYSRMRLLGGSSNHWENSTERLDPIDFKKREWVDDSGWPIAYEELAPFYPDAEEYCTVGRDGYDLNYWKRKLNYKDIFSESGLFNTKVVKSSPSPTRFFEKYGKNLTNSSHIIIIKNANVVDMDLDQDTQKVRSMVFRAFKETRHKVDAKAFVMCFGGIENARMLLVFNEKYNDQLGNQFDNVGRYFMEHPTIRAAHLLPFKEDALGKIYYEGVESGAQKISWRAALSESTQTKYRTNNMRMFFNKQSKLTLSSGVASTHAILDRLKENELPDNFGTHLLNVLKDVDLVAESVLRKSLATSVFDDAVDFGGYQMISMIEQTPHRRNRIKLGDKRDTLGLKKIIIDFHVSQNDKDVAWKTLELLAKDSAIQSIGRIRLLKDIESQIWGSQLGFGQHHMGTTKMSDTPNKGVVDSSLKVFGTKNLYISGSSVFPTGGHVPPTLTIVAVTIKLARELKERYLI